MTVQVLSYPQEKEWIEAKQRALVTIGKSSTIPPTEEWKRKMLNCRHSPIRHLMFSFLLSDIPYWLSTELCRHHEGIEKWVKSQRDDRNDCDIPREEKPQGAPVNVIIDVNAEALMTIMNKRLCGCATKEMQRLMMLIKDRVEYLCPEFKGFLVPFCEYASCKEFTPCGKNTIYFKAK